MSKVFGRMDLDVRGILAFIVIVCFFAVVFIQLGNNKKIEIPGEVAAVVTGVTGFYFGSRGAEGPRNGNGHKKEVPVDKI